MSKKKRILIDLDNTLLDFDGLVTEIFWRDYKLDVSDIVSKRKIYEIEDNFPSEIKKTCLDIIQEKDFYFNLKPFPDALETLAKINDKHNVFLCTTPHHLCLEVCLTQKIRWISQYLGEEWLSKTIFSTDKTLIDADYLIDDKPYISGQKTIPSWKRIIFHQSYNLDIKGTRLKKWKYYNDSTIL